MTTCKEHGRLTEMIEANTRLTTHTLQAVRRIESRVQKVAQDVARQDGAVKATKTSVGFVIGGAGVLVAVAALLANLLT